MYKYPYANVCFEHMQAALLAPFSKRETVSILKAMLEAANSYAISGAELTLTDDQHIAIINRRYLGCAGPTNIITFPGDADMNGSLFLSLDCLVRECLFYEQPRKTHFIRLLAHGTGHLAGLDHGPEMSELETRLIGMLYH